MVLRYIPLVVEEKTLVGGGGGARGPAGKKMEMSPGEHGKAGASGGYGWMDPVMTHHTRRELQKQGEGEGARVAKRQRGRDR